MSFWAVFTAPFQTPDHELDFEEQFWRELSMLSSEEE
jgi:FPC/CPF motif-containing protein YcgG